MYQHSSHTHKLNYIWIQNRLPSTGGNLYLLIIWYSTNFTTPSQLVGSKKLWCQADWASSPFSGWFLIALCWRCQKSEWKVVIKSSANREISVLKKWEIPKIHRNFTNFNKKILKSVQLIWIQYDVCKLLRPKAMDMQMFGRLSVFYHFLLNTNCLSPLKVQRLWLTKHIVWFLYMFWSERWIVSKMIVVCAAYSGVTLGCLGRMRLCKFPWHVLGKIHWKAYNMTKLFWWGRSSGLRNFLGKMVVPVGRYR